MKAAAWLRPKPQSFTCITSKALRTYPSSTTSVWELTGHSMCSKLLTCSSPTLSQEEERAPAPPYQLDVEALLLSMKDSDDLESVPKRFLRLHSPRASKHHDEPFEAALKAQVACLPMSFAEQLEGHLVDLRALLGPGVWDRVQKGAQLTPMVWYPCIHGYTTERRTQHGPRSCQPIHIWYSTPLHHLNNACVPSPQRGKGCCL